MTPEPRRILCFGDSLTWGFDPASGGRHGEDRRWPCVLQAALGAGFRVIAEGQGGRTTVFDDASSPVSKNGALALPVILSSQQPLDLVIVMLGANDLKPAICGQAEGAATGMARLVQLVRDHPWHESCSPPRLLLVSPPHFIPTDSGGPPRMGRVVAESHRLAPLYQALAAREGCAFFDAARVAVPSGIDGVHLGAPATRAIGLALAALIAHDIFPFVPERPWP